MCVEHKKICNCGRSMASLHFRDEILPEEVVDRLYCPSCSPDVSFDNSTMIKDNGWIIKYDMDVANFMRQKLPASDATPDFIFDEGYCTWNGVYPTDRADSVKEREELVQLSKINKKKYLEEFKSWGVRRMEQLKLEGWRKAVEKR